MLNLTQVLYLVIYLTQVLTHAKTNAKYNITLETNLCQILKFNNNISNNTTIGDAQDCPLLGQP